MENKQVCDYCGSEDVLVMRWINPNTEEIDSMQAGTEGLVNWCKNCKEVATLIEKPENLFMLISGYWKDDKVEFENYMVYAYDGVIEEDDSIFYYGLSEDKIKEAISLGIETDLEFVITKYQTVK